MLRILPKQIAMIKRIDVVTQAGAATYSIGDTINGYKVEKIRLDVLYFTGDPFDHYCGFDDVGNMVFSINCLCPCVVQYE